MRWDQGAYIFFPSDKIGPRSINPLLNPKEKLWIWVQIQTPRKMGQTCTLLIELLGNGSGQVNKPHQMVNFFLSCVWDNLILDSFLYYLAHFCYYLLISLHFLVLFIGFIVLFKLTFSFIYNSFSKNFQFQLNKLFPNIKKKNKVIFFFSLSTLFIFIFQPSSLPYCVIQFTRTFTHSHTSRFAFLLFYYFLTLFKDKRFYQSKNFVI